MSSIKLTADSGGGTVEFKAPPTTTSNAAKVITLSQNPGMITQVVQAVKTDIWSHDTDTYTNVTGLTVDITPSSTSNKILVLGVIHTGNEANDMTKIRIARDGTGIFVGDTLSNTVSGLCQWYEHHMDQYSTVPTVAVYLDSPNSTSSLTYSWQIRNQSGSNTVNVNETGHGGDSTQKFAAASSLIVMEVAV